MRKKLSFSPLIEGISKGVLTSLIPGLHPMVFGRMDPFVLGLSYGVFTGMSISLAKRGLFHPDTVYARGLNLSKVILGVLSGILLIPLAYLLYGISTPGWVLWVLLLLGGTLLGKGDPIAFLISGLLGIVTLKMPNSIVFPLESGLFYLYGLLFIFKEDNRPAKKEGTLWGGVLASLLTGYFPALPPSVWSRLVRGSTTLAAILTPIFSLVALIYGKTRSVLTSFIPIPYPEILFLVGAAFLLGVLLILSLDEIFHVAVALPREVGFGVLAAHAAYFGTGNMLLFLASLMAVRLAGRDPSSYFGFLVVPAIIYYS